MSEAGKLVIVDEEKTEVVHNSFASVFASNHAFHTSYLDGLQDGHWGSKVPPTVK